MLSKSDNETLTHVGPGTTMGKFMREYWIPAVALRYANFAARQGEFRVQTKGT